MDVHQLYTVMVILEIVDARMEEDVIGLNNKNQKDVLVRILEFEKMIENNNKSNKGKEHSSLGEMIYDGIN